MFCRWGANWDVLSCVSITWVDLGTKRSVGCVDILSFGNVGGDGSLTMGNFVGW